MNITDAKYNTSKITGSNGSINCIINNESWSVPLDPDNRHYAEILRQVDAGIITIEDAD